MRLRSSPGRRRMGKGIRMVRGVLLLRVKGGCCAIN